MSSDHSAFDAGFVHGRFQVFHKEHLEYVLAASRRCKFLMIGITQPDINDLLKSHDGDVHRHLASENPMTYAERAEAIRRSLVSEGLKEQSFAVVRFPLEQPDLLISHIPVTATAYTTICDKWNERKIELLKNTGYRVEVIFRRDSATRIRSSVIRKMIATGQVDWSEFVPAACRDYLAELEIGERLLAVSKGDFYGLLDDQRS